RRRHQQQLQALKNFEAQTPLGRIAQPEDIASIAVFWHRAIQDGDRRNPAGLRRTAITGTQRVYAVAPSARSMMSALVLSTNASTAARSAAGTWNSSSVALRCPMNADQSSSLIRIPLCEIFMSLPVYSSGPPAQEHRKS